jgi:hypothetical protein
MALIIAEIDAAAELAGVLFQATFGHAIPDFPRHFVAFHSRSEALHVVSYIHYTAWEDHSWLCGGLCVDRDAYRRADPTEAEEWKRAGGLGEILLRNTLGRLTDRVAIFGHCGDDRQWQHDLNVGFVPAADPNLLVIWNRPLDQAQRTRLIEKALALGAF